MSLPRLLLLLLLPLCLSLKIHKEGVKLRPNKKSIVHYVITQNVFGFQANGTIHLELNCNESLLKEGFAEPTQQLYLCRKEIQNVDDVPSMKTHCIGTEEERNVISDTEMVWMYEVKEASFYRLILSDDEERDKVVTCDIMVWLMNPPGDQHLSSDQLLIPFTYTTATFVWVFFTALWSLNFALFARFSNKLHKLLTFVILLKLANIGLSLFFWRTFAVRGQIDSQVRAPYLLSSSLFKTSIFLFLMLAAEGWCIIWERAKLLKYYLILGGSFFTMEMCYKFIHKYFQGFAIVFASMMVYIAFKCSTITVSTIRKNISASTQFVNNHKLSYHSEKTLLDRLNKQFLVMNCVQGLIIGLPCILIVVESMTAFLLLYEEWARLLIYEVVQLAVLIYCAAVFRLRDFSSYTEISIRTPFTSVSVIGTPYRGVLYISQPEEEAAEERRSEGSSSPGSAVAVL